jgi:hypothetical protein
VVDFHAEYGGPCKTWAEQASLASANPGGKLIVPKVDIDQQPQSSPTALGRFLDPGLLIKSNGGKETERQVGYGGKDKLITWLAIPWMKTQKAFQ